MFRSDSCVDGKALSSSKSCRPAFKRGMTGRTTEQLSPNDVGCQMQDITEI
jgi:hypothetical protein